MRTVGKPDTVSGVVVCHAVVDDIMMGREIQIHTCFQVVVRLRIDDRIVMRVCSQEYTILAGIVRLDLVDRRVVRSSCKIDVDICYAIETSAAIIFSVNIQIVQDKVALAIRVKQVGHSRIAFVYHNIS